MVLSQDGIFSRAEQATDKYGQAKARETLELALGEAQMQKYEQGLTEEQLDEQIKKVGSLIPKEDENSKYQLVIVEGHIFEIDRSVPKIVDYKGTADGIIITASIKQNGDWQNPVATVTGTITKYGGGTVTSSSAIATNGVTIPVDFPTAGGSYTIPNITTDTDITITAQDSEGHEPVTEVIKVRLVRDTTGPTITAFEATAEGLNIIISARAEDSESGMQSLTYNITSTEDTKLEGIPTDQKTGPLEQGKTITIETTPTGSRDITTYKIVITAKDNANNSTISPEKEVKTEDVVFKNIKTPEGLKRVKTRDIYGADVKGYICDRTEVEWQIFYIDEEDDHRVYLIAKDYVSPPVKNATPTLSSENLSNYPKAYRFGREIWDKTPEPIAITEFTTRFLNEFKGKVAGSNTNAVNYMLKQEIWFEYKDINKANEVYGGPPLPLFVASYNDICQKSRKLGYQVGSGAGYSVRVGNGNYGNKVVGIGNNTIQNGIYFKGNDSDSAYGMLMASPYSGSNSGIETASYTGEVRWI